METKRRFTVRPSADEWKLIRTLSDDLGLETTGVFRLGLRALVAMGPSVADRSLLKRHCSPVPELDRCTTMSATPKDLQIIALMREELGKGAGLSAICRLALHALARKEQLAHAAMSKERARLAAEERPPAPVVPAYVVLETKLCEICSKSFLRPIGSDVKHCAERHSPPVRPEKRGW